MSDSCTLCERTAVFEIIEDQIARAEQAAANGLDADATPVRRACADPEHLAILSAGDTTVIEL